MKTRRAALLLLPLAAVLAALVFAPGGLRGSAVDAEREARAAPAAERATPAALPEAPAPRRGEAATAASDERARAPAGDEPPAAPVAAGLPFRGQVVDAATEEPVPAVTVHAGGLRAETDAEGRFAAEGALGPEVEEVEVRDPFKGTHVRTLRRTALRVLPGGGWVAPIRIGPTYPLRVLGGPDLPLESWRARVVESGTGEGEQRHDWMPLHPGDPPWIRFDNPQERADEESVLELQVENADGTWRGSAPVASYVGIHPEVRVVIDELLAVLRGRVVDDAGRPRRGARILAVPADDPGNEDRWSRTQSSSDGAFELRSLVPGGYWITVRPRRGEDPLSRRVDAPPGESTLQDFVLTVQEPVGAIEGRLVSRSGARLNPAAVRLRATDGRAFDLYDRTRPTGSGASPPWASQQEPPNFFEFQQVPAGVYELTVVSFDGYEFTPSPLLVSPPNREIVLECLDDVPTWLPCIEAFDAQTGQELPFVEVELVGAHFRDAQAERVAFGESPGRVPAGTRFEWLASAPGRVAIRGNETAFMGAGERRVAALRMEPGFGALFLFRDCRGLMGAFEGEAWAGEVRAAEEAPVPGVRVIADGERAATSDGRGEAWLELPRAPERIELEAPGWTVFGSERLRDGRILGAGQRIVVWLARNP